MDTAQNRARSVLVAARDAIYGVLYLASRDISAAAAIHLTLQCVRAAQLLLFPLRALANQVERSSESSGGNNVVQAVTTVLAVLNASNLDEYVIFQWL